MHRIQKFNIHRINQFQIFTKNYYYVFFIRLMGISVGVREENKRRGENEKFILTSSIWINISKEPDAKHFIVSIFKIQYIFFCGGEVPGVIQSPVHK